MQVSGMHRFATLTLVPGRLHEGLVRLLQGGTINRGQAMSVISTTTGERMRMLVNDPRARAKHDETQVSAGTNLACDDGRLAAAAGPRRAMGL